MASPPSDTTPAAAQIQHQLLRQASPARRATLARRLSRTVVRSSRAAIQRRQPGLAVAEVLLTALTINYGARWAARLRPQYAEGPDTMTDPDMQAVLTPVIALFDHLGIRYHIGGSLASSVHGIPRATLDADLVALMEQRHVAPLVAALTPAFYCSAEEMRDALRQAQGTPSFNLIHLATAIKIDVFVPRPSAWLASRMNRAQRIALDDDPQAPLFAVASPEDMILTKLAWYESGNRVSERQWTDIVGMLQIQGAALDQAYLTEWAHELGVTEVLALARHAADAT